MSHVPLWAYSTENGVYIYSTKKILHLTVFLPHELHLNGRLLTTYLSWPNFRTFISRSFFFPKILAKYRCRPIFSFDTNNDRLGQIGLHCYLADGFL